MSHKALNLIVGLPDGWAPDIEPGDIIRTGENLHPHYRVIAIYSDRAWVRDVQFGADHIVLVANCRRVCD